MTAVLLSLSLALSGAQAGAASWYDDGPGLYAAVPSYHWGDARYRIRVCREGMERCVTVTVRDHCQCLVGTPSERAVDLSPDAFSRLAPLSAGIIGVTLDVGTLRPIDLSPGRLSHPPAAAGPAPWPQWAADPWPRARAYPE